MEVQQVHNHQAKMRRLELGLVGQLRRRKCKPRNRMNLEEGARERKNHKQLKNKNSWRLL